MIISVKRNFLELKNINELIKKNKLKLLIDSYINKSNNNINRKIEK